MVELKLGPHAVDLPYTIRIKGVTEELFDELVDEDTRAELLDGDMLVHSPASLRHDDIAGFYRTVLRCYAEEKELGRVFGPDSLVHLATCRRFAPDTYFVRQSRLRRRMSAKQFEGVPDLVNEVLSPSNWREDWEDKRPAYHQARVPELWWIDPDARRVLVERQSGGRHNGYRTTTATAGRVASKVVPGFWIDASWLWANPLPAVLACVRQILGEPRKPQ
jgi:Uma2 family endonuclease